MESPLLKLPGAVPADAPDQEVAGHYGEPAHEQAEPGHESRLVADRPGLNPQSSITCAP